MRIQEFNLEQSAKKYHIQLQRLAGKKVVDSLELYQYDFNSVLYKDGGKSIGGKSPGGKSTGGKSTGGKLESKSSGVKSEDNKSGNIKPAQTKSNVSPDKGGKDAKK